MDSHVVACPDIGYTNIEMFEHKEHFYNTQRVKAADGSFMPFADLNAIGQILANEKKKVVITQVLWHRL